jgi:hypothetical protein
MHLLYVLLLLMMFTACGNNLSGIKDEFYESAKVAQLTVVQLQQSDIDIIEELEWLRTTTFYHNPLGEVRIEYPQFSYFGHELLATFNRHIFDMVVLPEYREFADYRNSAEISYRITDANEQYISVHFYGYTDTGRYNVYEKAITISMVSGNILSLGDMFNNREFALIVELIMCLDSSEMVGITSEFVDAREIIYTHYSELLVNDDLALNVHDFYMTPNGIGLMCYFPLSTVSERLIVEVTLW